MDLFNDTTQDFKMLPHTILIKIILAAAAAYFSFLSHITLKSNMNTQSYTNIWRILCPRQMKKVKSEIGSECYDPTRKPNSSLSAMHRSHSSCLTSQWHMCPVKTSRGNTSRKTECFTDSLIRPIVPPAVRWRKEEKAKREKWHGEGKQWPLSTNYTLQSKLRQAVS